ncbi:MAG: hypothetical protein U5R14_15755 [Gemmatimonadota bacterium]|nr:hypothetical protein [Gemmatimonadota bacterium]
MDRGDSAGPGEDARLETWVDDVGWAADELRDMVGVDEISVVGLRFGAAIAVLAAQSRADVRRLVLWDPTVSGARFISEATGEQVFQGEETVGVEGIPLTPALRSEIEQVDLRTLDGVAGRATDIVVSGGDARCTRNSSRS